VAKRLACRRRSLRQTSSKSEQTHRCSIPGRRGNAPCFPGASPKTWAWGRPLA